MSKKKKYRVGIKVLDPIGEMLSEQLNHLGFSNMYTFKVTHSHKTHLIFMGQGKGSDLKTMEKIEKYLKTIFNGIETYQLDLKFDRWSNMIDDGEYYEIEVVFSRDQIRNQKHFMFDQISNSDLGKSAKSIIKFSL